MDILELCADKLNEGDYLTLCDILKKTRPPITMNTLVDTVFDRLPTKGKGFYKKTAILINSIVIDNYMDIHVPVEFLHLCFIDNPYLSFSEILIRHIKEFIVNHLKEMDTGIKVGVLFRYV